MANLIVDLIYISLTANKVEHLVVYLSAMWVFSKVKMLLPVLVHFSTELFECRSSPK